MNTQLVLHRSLMNPAFLRHLRQPLSVVTLIVGLALTSLNPAAAKPANASLSSSEPGTVVALQAAKNVQPMDAQAKTFPADGVYLYGQTPQPDQKGQAYMVFEVRNGKAVGAFYMPYSSFDCFYGSIQPSKLALTVIDSYEQSSHPYAVALDRSNPIAGQNPGQAEISIQGFKPLPVVSANDQRILGVCKANHGQQLL